MPELAFAIAPGADPSDPLSWVFEDISGFVRSTQDLQINYGRRDEGSLVDTTNVTLRLDNRDGRFTRLNPLSPYFRRISSGTPIRITITGGSNRLVLPAEGAYAQAPDAAAFDLAGDLDLRFQCQLAPPETVVAGVYQAPAVAGRFTSTGSVNSWQLCTFDVFAATADQDPDGFQLNWFPDGTFGNREVAFSGPIPPGRMGGRIIWLTLELDVSGSHRITWRRGESLSGPWVVAREDTRAGTTAIAASSQPLTVGAATGGISGNNVDVTFRGAWHGLQLRDGVNGTLVASPDFTAAALGTGGFTDAQGNTWAVNDGASISEEYELFQGFVREWPTRWDRSGRDSTVPIVATGQLRRLTRRERDAPRSVLHRLLVGGGPT